MSDEQTGLTATQLYRILGDPRDCVELPAATPSMDFGLPINQVELGAVRRGPGVVNTQPLSQLRELRADFPWVGAVLQAW